MELILTALLIIVFFAVLILGHETGHFAASKLLRLEVQEFGFGLPPKIFSRKWRGTEYSINAIPFGGFVKVPALDYSNGSEFKIPTWKKIVVFSSGVFMNFIISWVVFSIIFMIGTPKGVYVGGVIRILRRRKRALFPETNLWDLILSLRLLNLLSQMRETFLFLRLRDRKRP